METNTLYLYCTDTYRAENRAILERNILQRAFPYTNTAIHICKTPEGKPYLNTNQAFISIAHSKTIFVMALYAHEVGVDVEIHRELNGLNIAKRFFNQTQQAKIAQTPRYFFTVFTRCEALCKLKGIPLVRLLYEKEQDDPDVFFYTKDRQDPMCTFSVATYKKAKHIVWNWI